MKTFAGVKARPRTLFGHVTVSENRIKKCDRFNIFQKKFFWCKDEVHSFPKRCADHTEQFFIDGVHCDLQKQCYILNMTFL